MVEYFVLGAGTSIAAAVYTFYCHKSFYDTLKKAVVKKLAENKDRSKTLEAIFKEEGVILNSGFQPRKDIGTFFLKPTIHLTKVLLMDGRYDKLAEQYAAKVKV